MLIKGLSEFGETRILRHAAGEVTSEVSKQYTLKYELRRREEIKTGRVIKRSVLNFFHLKIPLYLGGISGDYSVQTEEKTLIIGGVKLPVSPPDPASSFLFHIPLPMPQDSPLFRGGRS